MTSATSPARPSRRAAARGFTLLEAAAVLAIMGIITAVSAYAFSRVVDAQSDLAGQPTLGAAQAQARRVAALNHYTWPFDTATPTPAAAFAGAMQVQQPTAAAGGVDYVAGPSPSATQVSVAWVDDSHAAFTVLTRPGQCLVLLDSLTDGSAWARDANVADGGCDAALAAQLTRNCPQAVTGTPDAPTPVQLSAGCPATAPASASPTP